jgi:hypothetical protein
LRIGGCIVPRDPGIVRRWFTDDNVGNSAGTIRFNNRRSFEISERDKEGLTDASITGI